MKLTFRQFMHRNFYLKTSYWRWVRQIIAERAGWWCEVRGCGKSGRHLDCHHRAYWVKWFEWLFPWMLVYLCREHHRATHNGVTLLLRRGRKLKPYKRG